MVDALKEKITKELRTLLKSVLPAPARDDIATWVSHCNSFYENCQDFAHLEKKATHNHHQNQNHHQKSTPAAPLADVGDPMDLDASRFQKKKLERQQNLCFYCKEPGHRVFECEAKKKADATRGPPANQGGNANQRQLALRPRGAGAGAYLQNQHQNRYQPQYQNRNNYQAPQNHYGQRNNNFNFQNRAMAPTTDLNAFQGFVEEESITTQDEAGYQNPQVPQVNPGNA